MAPAARPSVFKSARATDGDVTEAEVEENTPSFSLSTFMSSSSQTLRHPRPREPPRLERAVVSRTRFHITLPTPPTSSVVASANQADQRGWSSPHGEPYRPLGRPELNLKFSPKLVYGVSPMMQQNAHRVRTLETGGGLSNVAGGATGARNSAEAEKVRELREPSSCTSTGNAGASMTTLVDQFVTSLTSRTRPLDERQVKLAHRLRANVSGFSPERVRGLHRRKPTVQEHTHEITRVEQQTCYHTPRDDKSLQLLREAIDEGTSRLRATRNGTNFLQKLPPSDSHGLHELYEQYIRARMKTPQPGMICGSGRGAKSGPRALLESKVIYSRHPTHFSRDEDAPLGCTDSENEDIWYLPYTTRQLQRSPHRHLPSLEEFRVWTRDEKQSLRPSRASTTIKATGLPHTMKVRSNHASMISAWNSMAATAWTLDPVGGNSDDGVLDNYAAVPLGAASKDTLSPFAMATTSQLPALSVVPLHSIEKLQAAVDALETTKSQQSARLVTALEMLEQDRYECLADKFSSLSVRCDVVEDLRRMRERSERHRGQRVLKVVSKTADWYPELLRRLLTREGVSGSTAAINAGGLHAAEIFIVQAVRRFTNDGSEFQSKQLFQVILLIHESFFNDLELLPVQQLLIFLRNALHINHQEWKHFFAVHGLPEPIDDCAEERKDSPTSASTTRVAASAHVASFENHT